MEPRIINSELLTSGWFSLGFLVLGAIGSVLYSPKWHNLVYLASAYDVAPLPFTVLAVLGILTGIHTVAIFLVDRWLTNRTGHFLPTLFFACSDRNFIDYVKHRHLIICANGIKIEK
jgi:hypothetical protein